MNFVLKDEDLSKYLQADQYVNYDEEKIQAKANELFKDNIDEGEIIRIAYEFVRDEITHNWDNQSERVTIKASEVLTYKEGICYAQTMLLAALLRSRGIHTGFCYQRVSMGDIPGAKHAIHALNAVYLSLENRWIRLDPHREINGKLETFSIKEDQIAFSIRTEYDEIDYPGIYSTHVEIITQTLEHNSNCIEMINCNLPARL